MWRKRQESVTMRLEKAMTNGMAKLVTVKNTAQDMRTRIATTMLMRSISKQLKKYMVEVAVEAAEAEVAEAEQDLVVSKAMKRPVTSLVASPLGVVAKRSAAEDVVAAEVEVAVVELKAMITMTVAAVTRATMPAVALMKALTVELSRRFEAKAAMTIERALKVVLMADLATRRGTVWRHATCLVVRTSGMCHGMAMRSRK